MLMSVNYEDSVPASAGTVFFAEIILWIVMEIY